MEIEIEGIKYNLVEQTEDEIKENGVCAGCIAKENEWLCEKLGECYDAKKDYKFILKQENE